MFKQLLIFCALICFVHSKSVIVGQINEYGGQVRKVHEKQTEATGFPLLKREEEITFEYPHGDQRIKGIAIKDLENGLAEPSITRGGLGFNFVNIKLKSERGSGYKFLIEIYASMGLLEFEQWSNQPDIFSDHSHFCSKLRLTPGQRRVCRRHKEHMPVVSAGVRSGIQECQHQFSGRRWNCTVSEDGTVFGPLSFIASRETAFTYAVTAAGVSLSVSRACRDGRLSSCTCSRSPRPKHLHNEWVWGGCGDNLEYGYKFTESFVDIRERERKVKRGSREQGRQLMNRHNNEAGRRAVIVKSKVTCKCHGVSGSCSLITCWNQLASFREVGDYLKDKYDGATEVKVSRRGKLRISNPRFSLPTSQDLVYLEESPNFCVKNESVGSQGTTGRECNRTSSGMEGCSLMCCGRGYNTKRVVARERCNCKFHWCCRVDCDTCVKSVEVYTCK